MINKEWLLTLDDEVLADLILDGLQRFARMSTSSIHYLTEWLGKEHTKDDYVEKYFISKGVEYEKDNDKYKPTI